VFLLCVFASVTPGAARSRLPWNIDRAAAKGGRRHADPGDVRRSGKASKQQRFAPLTDGVPIHLKEDELVIAVS
jgi:hypothetical protein